MQVSPLASFLRLTSAPSLYAAAHFDLAGCACSRTSSGQSYRIEPCQTVLPIADTGPRINVNSYIHSAAIESFVVHDKHSRLIRYGDDFASSPGARFRRHNFRCRSRNLELGSRVVPRQGHFLSPTIEFEPFSRQPSTKLQLGDCACLRSIKRRDARNACAYSPIAGRGPCRRAPRCRHSRPSVPRLTPSSMCVYENAVSGI
jgi:hypothetical protein